MFQIGHYKMLFPLHKDKVLHHTVHCSMFHCNANYGFLWLWGLYLSWKSRKSFLALWWLCEAGSVSAKTEMASAQTFPQIKKQMVCFTYCCCIPSHFSTEFCHSFLFSDHVSQLTSFCPVISVYSNSATNCKMLSIYMHLLPFW